MLTEIQQEIKAVSRSLKPMRIDLVPKPTSISEIVITVICEYYDVNRAYLSSKSRRREHVIPRQVAIYFIAKFLPGTTLKHIGGLFGGRDHSTVIHSVNSVQSFMDVDKEYKAKVMYLNDYFKNEYGLF
jgi:chromosomal replication initiator protein